MGLHAVTGAFGFSGKYAETAKVERIVHISTTNPSEGSPLEYFRGKAIMEREFSGKAEFDIVFCVPPLFSAKKTF
jgi:hypothetical protein